MKIHAPSFGIAGATTVSLIYTTIALALKFWPTQTLKLIATAHMLPKLTLLKSFIHVTPQTIATGIATHAIAGFFVFWLIATIYNLLQK